MGNISIPIPYIELTFTLGDNKDYCWLPAIFFMLLNLEPKTMLDLIVLTTGYYTFMNYWIKYFIKEEDYAKV